MGIESTSVCIHRYRWARLIVLALLGLGFAFSNSVRGNVSAQVIGGEDAADGQYPWMGALIWSDYDDIADDQFCGCMLIDSSWILTAAHCVDDLDLEDFVIAIGDSNLDGEPRILSPKMILVNPAKYHRLGRGGDVALIQLTESVTDIDPISFRRLSDGGDLPEFGRILGWGRTALTEEGVEQVQVAALQEVDLPIRKPGDAFLVDFGFEEYLPEYIATGQTDPIRGALSGDSGGPLLIEGPGEGEWIVAGIDSWGGGSSTERAAVSMFTDVSLYSDWINEDDSVTVYPSERDDASRALFIRKWEDRESLAGNGVFTLSPYQLTRGSSVSPGAVFEQNQSVFKLSDISAGSNYRLGFWKDAGSSVRFDLYEKGPAWFRLFRSDYARSGNGQIEFRAEAGFEYWLSVGRDDSDYFEFEFYLQEYENRSVDSNVWHEGALEESDASYRRPGVKMDVYSKSDYLPGDVKVEVESVFDAVVVDSLGGSLVSDIWDVNAKDYIETDFGSFSNFVFEPERGNQYVVYVSSSSGERNMNYQFRVVGDEIIEDPLEDEWFLDREKDGPFFKAGLGSYESLLETYSAARSE